MNQQEGNSTKKYDNLWISHKTTSLGTPVIQEYFIKFKAFRLCFIYGENDKEYIWTCCKSRSKLEHYHSKTLNQQIENEVDYDSLP